MYLFQYSLVVVSLNDMCKIASMPVSVYEHVAQLVLQMLFVAPSHNDFVTYSCLSNDDVNCPWHNTALARQCSAMQLCKQNSFALKFKRYGTLCEMIFFCLLPLFQLISIIFE